MESRFFVTGKSLGIFNNEYSPLPAILSGDLSQMAMVRT
jgi:hypothetical protein